MEKRIYSEPKTCPSEAVMSWILRLDSSAMLGLDFVAGGHLCLGEPASWETCGPFQVFLHPYRPVGSGFAIC